MSQFQVGYHLSGSYNYNYFTSPPWKQNLPIPGKVPLEQLSKVVKKYVAIVSAKLTNILFQKFGEKIEIAKYLGTPNLPNGYLSSFKAWESLANVPFSSKGYPGVKMNPQQALRMQSLMCSASASATVSSVSLKQFCESESNESDPDLDKH